jgi:hypothetical protein
MFMRIVGQSTGAALYGALVNAALAHDVRLEDSLRIVNVAAALVAVVVLVLGARLPARLNPRLTLE